VAESIGSRDREPWCDSKSRTSACSFCTLPGTFVHCRARSAIQAHLVRLVLYTQSGLPIMSILLADQIDTLAAFVPTELPVISLYLNTQSGDHGRDNFASFLKKELTTRARTFAP
jgi:hypothetical protein